MKGKTAFRLRKAALSDLDALLALEHASFTTDLLSRRRMRHWITATNGILLVADAPAETAAPSSTPTPVGGKAPRRLAGYCLAMTRRNSPVARVYSLAIAAFARGHGLGSRLMLRAEKEGRLHGSAAMQLEVATHNAAALALYQKLQYEIIASLPAFYEDGGDAWRMRKDFTIRR